MEQAYFLVFIQKFQNSVSENICISSQLNRQNLAWLGGSRVSKTDELKNILTLQSEYYEQGVFSLF